MKALVAAMAAAVRRAPVVIVVATLVVAGVLGSFAGQVEVATGNEGFAPDNAEIEALEQIGELFSTDQESVFQVIIREPGGDVISADGLRAVAAVEEVIREEAGEVIADTEQRPGVVSYLAPAVAAAEAQRLEPGDVDDATVDMLYQAALAEMPAEQAGLVSSLLAQGAEGAAAQSGLILAFLEVENGGDVEEFDAQIELETRIAEGLEDIEADVEVRPFSINLLFGEVDSFTNEVGRLFAFAGIIIVVILLFVYWMRPRGSATFAQTGRRTFADMLITLATILLAIGMMQGGGVLLEKMGVISAFSAPTQIVPILIIGLGVDYGIHLISRYREEAGEGLTVDDSMTVSIGTSGVALVLATLTTVIGFLTNLANPVPALTDFGILAAVGIFFAFLLMMTFVPAVRVLLDRRAESSGRLPVEAMASHGERILPQLMGRTAVIAERVPYVALVLALILGGLGYFGFTQLETRFSFTDFLPEDAPAIQTMEILEEDFGGGFGEQTQVLITAPEGGDLSDGTYWNLMVDASSDVAEVDSVFTFDTALGRAADADSPVGVFQRLFAGGPQSAPPEVLAAAQEVGMGPDQKVPEGADMSAVYEALTRVVPDQISGVTHFEGGRLEAVLFDVRTTAGETEVTELRQALDGVFAPFEAAGSDAIATSQNIVSDVVVQALTDSQSWSLLLTLAAAGVVLIIYFWIQNRRPFLGFITIFPVVLVVMWTYGLMYVTGIPFGPVTATLAALAIGIGVPYTIHLARRFEEDRVEMDDVEDAIRSTTTHTGGALAGSAFTTMAGFGILITSSLVPFKQMGLMTVYAIGLALVASILVLPSMLVLWERWHRRRAVA
ncbi:MAG TPA: MMPL family transporter [Acidimicrobiia bacterium]|nr:MMPL family transporter [Acidimicrobiia bacterium]